MVLRVFNQFIKMINEILYQENVFGRPPKISNGFITRDRLPTYTRKALIKLTGLVTGGACQKANAGNKLLKGKIYMLNLSNGPNG
jgi:hypothetical protein